MRGIISIFNHHHLLVCVHVPRSLRDKINTEKPPSLTGFARVCGRLEFMLILWLLFSKTSSKWIQNLFIFVRDSSINSIPREFLRVPVIITREDEKTCCGRHRSQYKQKARYTVIVAREIHGSLTESQATLACSYDAHTSVRRTCGTCVGSPSITFPQFHTIISCVVANVSNSAHRCSEKLFYVKRNWEVWAVSGRNLLCKLK